MAIILRLHVFCVRVLFLRQLIDNKYCNAVAYTLLLGAAFVRAASAYFTDLGLVFTLTICRDTTIYSAICHRLSDQLVAVKVYDKSRVSTTKFRAIKREIAMMMFFERLK